MDAREIKTPEQHFLELLSSYLQGREVAVLQINGDQFAAYKGNSNMMTWWPTVVKELCETDDPGKDLLLKLLKHCAETLEHYPEGEFTAIIFETIPSIIFGNVKGGPEFWKLAVELIRIMMKQLKKQQLPANHHELPPLVADSLMNGQELRNVMQQRK